MTTGAGQGPDALHRDEQNLWKKPALHSTRGIALAATTEGGMRRRNGKMRTPSIHLVVRILLSVLAAVAARAEGDHWTQGVSDLRAGDNLQRVIMNPLVAYDWCNYYLGNEVGRWLLSDTGSCEPEHEDLDCLVDEHGNFKPPAPLNCRLLTDVALVTPMDIIYCQVDFFEIFRTEVLPALTVPIILITGQWFLPQLKWSGELLWVVEHPMIGHWFAQNPVLDHPKYSGFPYGISHQRLGAYAEFLLRHQEEVEHPSATISTSKTSLLANLPVTTRNSPSRASLPQQPLMPYPEFLESVARAQYLVSPVGDRPDTYRHMEAIGLGTIPVCCDCPIPIANMYCGEMLVEAMPGAAPGNSSSTYNTASRIGKNVKCIEGNFPQLPDELAHSEPRRVQREMIFASFWKERIFAKIRDLSASPGRCDPGPGHEG